MFSLEIPVTLKLQKMHDNAQHIVSGPGELWGSDDARPAPGVLRSTRPASPVSPENRWLSSLRFVFFAQFVVRFGLIWFKVAEKCLEKCMIFMRILRIMQMQAKIQKDNP